MAFGILESGSNPHPPGTVFLADNSSDAENTEAVISRSLKHGTGANEHIVLVPQPSNDPNDPLNWSICYRDSVVLAIVFCTFTFAGAIGPLLSPIAFQLVMEYNVSFKKVSLLTGWQLLTVAIVGFFVSPATRKIGKRPVIIICSLLGLSGSIWLIFAGSYNSLLGARVLQAFGVAFYESVGFSMIADMYCVHERGSRIAAYLFPLGAFNVLCPLLAGVVAQNMGIKWMYRWMAIFAGLATIVVLFYIPETAFNRSEIYNIDTSSVNNLGELAEKQGQESHMVTSDHVESPPTNTIDSSIPKRSYLYRLRPWSATESFSNASFISLAIGPLKLFLNPAVLWSCLTQGAVSAWTVAVSFILSQIFAVPPYNYNPAQVGYLNTGAMIGGLFAEIICVLSNDRLAKAFARKNGGTYEPEFRLWIIIPMIITGAIGFFGFGNSIAEGHGPIVASMFYGFITASLIFSHVASSSYMTDAFRNHSIEIFIDVMVFKNLLFFVFSLVVNDWIAKDGPRKVFNIIGALQLAIGFLSIPLYLLGKKNRALMHKWWFMN
ncbi:major facilitator superfamily transporter [Phlyctema vagabunda]|uniref:Major facilitator superfamily transporter n=1 Tax=Phlyctema vagabunda TaxID=108571 RepID=A0ABR4PTW8_9HELO